MIFYFNYFLKFYHPLSIKQCYKEQISSRLTKIYITVDQSLLNSVWLYMQQKTGMCAIYYHNNRCEKFKDHLFDYHQHHFYD